MRINFFGGPGTGKSTSASWLFAALKLKHASVELVSEYAKFWAYQKRKIHKYDQLYLFGKQMQNEYKLLVNGVKNTITDSPVLLSAVYAELSGSKEIAKNLQNISIEYDRDFPCFNIILDRGDKLYVEEGRYQTKEEAQKVDQLIAEYVHAHYPASSILDSHHLDHKGMLDKVSQIIDR